MAGRGGGGRHQPGRAQARADLPPGRCGQPEHVRPAVRGAVRPVPDVPRQHRAVDRPVVEPDPGRIDAVRRLGRQPDGLREPAPVGCDEQPPVHDGGHPGQCGRPRHAVRRRHRRPGLEPGRVPGGGLQPLEPVALRLPRLLVRGRAQEADHRLDRALARCPGLAAEPAAGDLPRLVPVEADPHVAGAGVRARRPAGRPVRRPERVRAGQQRQPPDRQAGPDRGDLPERRAQAQPPAVRPDHVRLDQGEVAARRPARALPTRTRSCRSGSGWRRSSWRRRSAPAW